MSHEIVSENRSSGEGQEVILQPPKPQLEIIALGGQGEIWGVRVPPGLVGQKSTFFTPGALEPLIPKASRLRKMDPESIGVILVEHGALQALARIKTAEKQRLKPLQLVSFQFLVDGLEPGQIAQRLGIKTEVIKRNIVDATRTLGAQNKAHATTILVGNKALSLNKALETKSEEDWEKLERLESRSRRQWEVLERIARGYTNKKIAHSLHIRYLTVQRRVRRLYRNLGLTGEESARRKAAVLYLIFQERKKSHPLS